MLFFCEWRKFIQFKWLKLQFWPLNDQIIVPFVRAARVLAKDRMRPAGRMFDMPDLDCPYYILLLSIPKLWKVDLDQTNRTHILICDYRVTACEYVRWRYGKINVGVITSSFILPLSRETILGFPSVLFLTLKSITFINIRHESGLDRRVTTSSHSHFKVLPSCIFSIWSVIQYYFSHSSVVRPCYMS